MPESIRVSTTLPVTPKRLYTAWLNAKEHSAFTGGGKATCSPRIGGKFTAWDGYISGTNQALEPYKRILQAWRTTEFPHEAPDSSLEVLLEEVRGSTKITVVHTNIPDGQGESYKQGWLDYYFEPMKEYFTSNPR